MQTRFLHKYPSKNSHVFRKRRIAYFLMQLKFFFCTNKLTIIRSVFIVKKVLYFRLLELLS